MFTIEVKKRKKDEEFEFMELIGDANIIHDDCYGGKVEGGYGGYSANLPGGYHWEFECKRCNAITQIDPKEVGEAKLKIAQTAIDGEERKLSDNVRVVQKS